MSATAVRRAPGGGLSARARREARVKVIDVYCRISVDYDGTTRSVDSQEMDALEVIDDHDDWTLGVVHKDHAKSGWDPRIKRPSFEALMVRLQTGQADGVIVYDLSRFTRKPIEGEVLLALAGRGLVVSSITTEYNLRTATGRKQFRTAMADAAFESDQISERVSRGIRNKAKRGKSTVSARAYARPGYLPKPVGWVAGDRRDWVSDAQLNAEKETVREAARRFIAGDALSEIARDFNARGIPTPAAATYSAERLAKRHAEGCIPVWTSVVITGLLTSPSIAGIPTYRDNETRERIRVEGMWLEPDPALDRDTFDTVEALFNGGRRGRPNAKSLLGGVARCGKCGATLTQAPGRDGRVLYRCILRFKGTATEIGCGGVSIGQEFADTFMREATLKRLSDPTSARRISEGSTALTAARQAIQDEIAALKAAGLSVAGKYGTKGWDEERVDAALATNADLMEKARAALAALDEPETFTAPNVAAERWAAAEKAGDVRTMSAMVREAFPRLAITPSPTRGPKSGRNPDRIDLDGKALDALGV